MPVAATCLGFPRIGARRELKKALESYWSGTSSGEELLQAARELRRRHWSLMKACGIDIIPSNDFSLYDHVLDMAITVGAIPARYRRIGDPLARMFAMARGCQDAGSHVPALEMTKWFDTNYHYIVPELEVDQVFRLDAAKILGDIEEAKGAGPTQRPVLVGPVTFLLLSKLSPGAPKIGRRLWTAEDLARNVLRCAGRQPPARGPERRRRAARRSLAGAGAAR